MPYPLHASCRYQVRRDLTVIRRSTDQGVVVASDTRLLFEAMEKCLFTYSRVA